MIFLSSTGYITARAYTSEAEIPLKDVAISVTAADGTALALRLTDRSGLIEPIPVPTPERSAGESPDTGEIPFTTVNLYARFQGFEQVEMEHLQVFPGTVTQQNIELVPLSELPGAWDQTAVFDTPPQNL